MREELVEQRTGEDITDPETKRACRIATLRGLLNFHKRSTVGIDNPVKDMYTDALEAAIAALEACEKR